MEALKKSILNILEDNKAQNISLIDVKNKSSVTDVMFIVSGRSTRHVKAIADNLVTKLKKNKIKQNKQIVLSFKDEDPIEGKGYFGIRAWGGAVLTDMLRLQLPSRNMLVDQIKPIDSTYEKLHTQSPIDLAERRAVKDLCTVIFNISEFIYID